VCSSDLVLAFAVPFLLKTPTGLPWVLAAGAAFLFLGLWAFRPRELTAGRWMAALAGAMLLITLAAKATSERDKSSAALIDRAPRDAQWISAGYYFQNLPMKTGRRAVVVAGTGELEFGRDSLPPAERTRWFREDLNDLNAVARDLRMADGTRPVWALIDSDAWPRLTPEQRGAWEIVDRTKAAYLARLR
jgi:hypothetical protein